MSKRKRQPDKAKRTARSREKKRSWVTAAILAAGIAAALVAWQWPATLWGFKSAPSFTLQSSTGRIVSLEDFRDKKEVVLIFYMGAG